MSGVSYGIYFLHNKKTKIIKRKNYLRIEKILKKEFIIRTLIFFLIVLYFFIQESMKQYKITDFTQHTDDPTSYDGTVVINGKELSVDIILEDEGETEKIEQQMNSFFSEINTLLPKAKECIAEKYLDLYNSNWRFGDDEDDPDKPELTKKEFMDALSLQSLLFYSEDIEVFFDDNDMFLGHSLIASEFDGLNFNDAQMFG